jgi:signal transduction histidine kinase
MKNVIRRWESFLRLERLTSASDLFKARAIYLSAIAFFFVQSINLAQMTVAYGGWILDHSLLVFSIVMLSGSSLTLRYHTNFNFFAMLWGILILVAVGASAMPTNVGINSALLPVLVSGVIIVSILGSGRILSMYCLSAVILTGVLHFNAAEADITALADPAYVALRNSQRTMQTLIAITLAGVVVGLISNSMNNLFASLERNLATSRTAEAAKTQFLADMSHELRTPLNGVLGMNQLLLRTELNDVQRNYAEIVEDCGKGMIVMIDDILDLSRLEADKIALTETAFNPAKMLESINALYQANANAKNIELNVIIEPGLPAMFMGDHGRLRQIISNLINNAVKFTDMGYITVSMRALDLQDGRWWMNFFVQDSGIGITPDRLAKIFQRFEQAQDGQTNTVRGSGLGLAICRELTDLFGGEISVTSEPGKGSLFCVALPLGAVVLDKAVPETLPERPQEVVMKRGVA